MLNEKNLLHNQLISVVLCTFNGAEFVKEQLDTLLAQTYPIDELIVVDDGSTDNTVDIVKAFAENRRFIKIYENAERLGAIKNFEKALLLTKNELIAIADQDDIWHPKKLEKLVSNFSDDSLLIYCNSVRFVSNPDFSAKTNPRWQRFEGNDGRKLFIFNWVSGHAMLIRKRLLQFILPFHQNVMYDWWSGIVAAYNGGVQYIPEVLVLQRVHGNNVSIDDSLDWGNSKTRINFKRMVLPHLQQFAYTPGMPVEHKLMVEKIAILWEEALVKKFSVSLFFFLMKYRRLLFSFKKKKLVFFTHLKYSWWFSKN